MFILLVFSSLSYSQTTILNLDNSKTSATVVHDDMQYFTALFTYNEIIASDTETSNGSYCEIYIPNTFFIGELGFPKLPASRKLIEIPFGAEVTIKVLSYTLKEYDLEKFGITNKIIPVQPSVRKDQDAEMIPFELNHEIYGKDKYLEYDIATVDILGVLRNTRMAQLTIAPVSYNPVRNTIKIYNNIEVEISFSPADEELNRYIKSSVRSLWFEPVQNMLFNNPGSKDLTFNDLTKYPVKYLVVAPRMFEADLQPFIEWKTKKGFEMIVAYTDEIGMDFKSIQQWIHDQYNSATPDDPAPSFLLLVGDTPLIPSSTGSSTGKSTDLYYASVDGDYFPEMYYGRFSANNSAELISQIEKTLYYEQYQLPILLFLTEQL
ncbi:MAG TPA: C25 family cysteine peptidase [Bacteroidales bacterium]|nr:C25 family cysteine peptidase [Bacteroidales bacterium]